jgi:hypothetical protein
MRIAGEVPLADPPVATTCPGGQAESSALRPPRPVGEVAGIDESEGSARLTRMSRLDEALSEYDLPRRRTSWHSLLYVWLASRFEAIAGFEDGITRGG